MEKPVIAQKEPIEVELKKGEKYWWCQCGRSQSQPFCDGSHEGTTFSPLQYEAKRSRRLFFCACKYTKKPPFCDGSHSKL